MRNETSESFAQKKEKGRLPLGIGGTGGIIERSPKGSSIKYVRKIFRKTNISDPLIRTRTLYVLACNVSFLEILRTYLMDDP